MELKRTSAMNQKYNISSVEDLLQQGREFHFFWGDRPRKDGKITSSCLSQWFKAGFKYNDIYYPTAEHWMMAGKARLFGDQKALQYILDAPTPKDAKDLGREVRGFDQKLWESERYKIVLDGNILKFSQNPDLRDFLLSTEDQILVEASPYDKIWGVGLKKEDPSILRPDKWKGLNLLGFALMEARDVIKLRIENED
jgi:ribA/ribD-fused uncharacterized protein